MSSTDLSKVFVSSKKTYLVDQDKNTDPASSFAKAVSIIKTLPEITSFDFLERNLGPQNSFQHSCVSDQYDTSGKGLTRQQCMASASMEFLERYSWYNFDYRHYNGYIEATYEQIQRSGTRTVDESYFLSNYLTFEYSAKSLEYLKKLKLKWIKGKSLTKGDDYYYPLNWNNYQMSSNGLSAGNSYPETVVQAICEVIERENVYRFFIKQQPGRDINAASIKNPLLIEALENAAKSGVEFIFKDISFVAGIPTVLACGVCDEFKGTLLYKGVGQGTHTDPEKALIRAVTEYIEGFSLMKMARDKTGGGIDVLINNPLKKHFGFFVSINDHMLSRSTDIIDLSDISNLSQDDFLPELNDLLVRLSSLSYEPVLIDKTHPLTGIPAVRVMIPGMRSCINSEFNDPGFIIWLAAIEAGDHDGAQYFAAKARDFFKEADYMMDQFGKYAETDYLAFLNSAMQFKKHSATAMK